MGIQFRYRGTTGQLPPTSSPPSCSTAHTPLGDRGEVGEHVSGHHVQTCFCEFQVEILQVVISLGHRVLIRRPQAGAGEGCLYSARGRNHTWVRSGLREEPRGVTYHQESKLNACTAKMALLRKPTRSRVRSQYSYTPQAMGTMSSQRGGR